MPQLLRKLSYSSCNNLEGRAYATGVVLVSLLLTLLLTSSLFIVNFEQVIAGWVIYENNISNVDFACSIWAILWVPFVNCSLKLPNDEK